MSKQLCSRHRKIIQWIWNDQMVLCLLFPKVRWVGSSVRTVPFYHKHCWQLSKVIKSHVTKPSSNQPWSSDNLKVVWAWVCVYSSHTGGTCVPTPQLLPNHHGAIHSQSLWWVSDKPHSRLAWCADTNRIFSISVFLSKTTTTTSTGLV